MIKEDRIKNDIEILSMFNATPDCGVTGLSFSDEDWQAREYIKSEMIKIGLDIREDGYSTIFGRLNCSDNSAKTLMIGSHYDSVVNGGKFDGAAGVVCALEIARAIVENNIKLPFNLDIVAMNDEEGVRFGGGVANSRVMIGEMPEEYLDTAKDKNGISLRNAMISKGVEPDLKASILDKESLLGFIELHIEQGKILESENVSIGIVDSITGIYACKLEFLGESGHVGTLRMSERKDALVAASKVILEMNRLALSLDNCVASVGEIRVIPNAPNVVPRNAIISVDLRSPYTDKLEKLKFALDNICNDITKESGIEINRYNGIDITPALMDSDFIKSLETSAKKLKYSYKIMPSLAGHDAMNLAKICPTAMVFVPSKNGLSHHPDEWSDYTDLKMGASVILDTILNMTM